MKSGGRNKPQGEAQVHWTTRRWTTHRLCCSSTSSNEHSHHHRLLRHYHVIVTLLIATSSIIVLTIISSLPWTHIVRHSLSWLFSKPLHLQPNSNQTLEDPSRSQTNRHHHSLQLLGKSSWTLRTTFHRPSRSSIKLSNFENNIPSSVLEQHRTFKHWKQPSIVCPGTASNSLGSIFSVFLLTLS